MPEDRMKSLEFLQGFRRGDLLREIDLQMERVLEGIRDTGGSGEVTLRLPFKINKAGQLECMPKVTSKVPNRSIGTGIYYLTDEAGLTRRDPNQADWVDEIEQRRRTLEN